jgi:hypothetical protein
LEIRFTIGRTGASGNLFWIEDQKSGLLIFRRIIDSANENVRSTIAAKIGDRGKVEVASMPEFSELSPVRVKYCDLTRKAPIMNARDNDASLA